MHFYREGARPKNNGGSSSDPIENSATYIVTNTLVDEPFLELIFTNPPKEKKKIEKEEEMYKSLRIKRK